MQTISVILTGNIENFFVCLFGGNGNSEYKTLISKSKRPFSLWNSWPYLGRCVMPGNHDGDTKHSASNHLSKIP